MRLNEAIQHTKEKSEECSGTQCGRDHEQLRKWLIELKNRRKKDKVEYTDDDDVFNNLTDVFLLKSRYGRYEDNAKNRALHRVGQEYGSKKEEEQKEQVVKPKGEESKEGKQYTKEELTQKLEETKANKEKWVAKKGEDYYNKRVAKIERLLKQAGVEEPNEKEPVENTPPTKTAIEQPEQTKEKVKNNEPQNDEVVKEEEEIQARIKFDDLPNSGKVKFKKYLSNRIKTRIDDSFKNLTNLDDDVVQTLHDNLVKTFNDTFDNMKKSERAESLYKIMKVKEELKKRNDENSVAVPIKDRPILKTYSDYVEYSINRFKLNNLPEETQLALIKSQYAHPADMSEIPNQNAKYILHSIESLGKENTIAGFHNVLESFGTSDENTKRFINQSLIAQGYQPILSGVDYQKFEGVDYKYFIENNIADAENYYHKLGLNINHSEEESSAIASYTSSEYQNIRAYNNGDSLSNIPKKSKERIIHHVETLQSYIEKHPLNKNLVLKRCMEISRNSIDKYLNNWLTAEIGDIIEDNSFSSFSLNTQVQFGSDLQVTFLAKKGQQIGYLFNDAETEFLTQKGSKFKVVAKGLNSIVVTLVEE